MSGCLLFLHRFGRRRRERAPGSPLGCGSVSTRPLAAGLPPHYAAAMALPGHHTLDVLCSPASDDDSASFSSATSSASSAAAFYSRSSSSSLGGPPSCGVPSPTGHLSSRSAEAAAHQAAIHAACQVLLVEHQVLSRVSRRRLPPNTTSTPGPACCRPARPARPARPLLPLAEV
jgi:hypothetical protein